MKKYNTETQQWENADLPGWIQIGEFCKEQNISIAQQLIFAENEIEHFSETIFSMLLDMEHEEVIDAEYSFDWYDTSVSIIWKLQSSVDTEQYEIPEEVDHYIRSLGFGKVFYTYTSWEET